MFPFAEKLKNYLLENISSAKVVSGGDTIVCRCPYCGDSHKHAKSAHFYISLPTEEKPALYYCHLCHSSGVFTHKTLMDLNCYDPEISNELYAHNASIPASSGHKRTNAMIGNFNIKNEYIRDNPLSYTKMDYLNYRLGTRLDFSDMQRLKIVLNLEDILGYNHISTYTRDQRIMEQLDQHFIGFLSKDNGYVILRKCDNAQVYHTINTRYVNYKIFNTADNEAERFYVIPQNIDLSNPNRIKLHIAEGIFDILSIYLNLNYEEPGIYAAVCGSNYSSMISYFTENMMIPNLEIHLYPDADQTDYNMDRIVSNFDSLRMPIYIHRNITEGQKDFGVAQKYIHDAVRRANRWV